MTGKKWTSGEWKRTCVRQEHRHRQRQPVAQREQRLQTGFGFPAVGSVMGMELAQPTGHAQRPARRPGAAARSSRPSL